MKILHVIPVLYTGGAEKLMVDLLPLIAAQGHQVELCVFDGTRTPFHKQIEKAGVKIHWFHKGGNVYNPLNIWRLWRLMRKGWDIVHTHNTAPQLFAAIASLFCKSALVTTEHNSSNRRRNWGPYVWIDRWMYSRYRHIICVSEQTAINLLKYLGDKKAWNVRTIYNGFDFYRYACSAAANDVRKLGKRIITNVAAFRNSKDQPTLIKAMTHLPPDYHLCLVGNGERQKEYENLVKELGLGHRIHFLGIRMDVPQILAASDYVVMCSHFEGFPLSSLEGMASGKPFLSDNVDGLREIVTGYGVTFEHEDAKGFADAILRLEQDADYRAQIVKQCQARAIQFDMKIMAIKCLEIYKMIIEL